MALAEGASTLGHLDDVLLAKEVGKEGVLVKEIRMSLSACAGSRCGRKPHKFEILALGALLWLKEECEAWTVKYI